MRDISKKKNRIKERDMRLSVCGEGIRSRKLAKLVALIIRRRILAKLIDKRNTLRIRRKLIRLISKDIRGRNIGNTLRGRNFTSSTDNGRNRSKRVNKRNIIRRRIKIRTKVCISCRTEYKRRTY